MIEKSLYHAIFKSITGKLLVYIVQFFCLAVYARLFTPEQFGIVASIQVFVIFFQLLSDVGIGPAIINEDNFNNKKRDGVFTFCFIIGCLVGVIFYLFSYLLNEFYDGYKYQDIAIIVAISIVFNSMSILPITAFISDAKFIKMARLECVSELITFFIVYRLWGMGLGTNAIVFRILSFSLFKLIFSWYFSKDTTIGRASFGKEVFHVKSLLSFASYQFGFNFINYFTRNLDNILIGKYLGMNMLGLYDKAYQLMRYPLMLTSFAMSPAIQPILTTVRSDIDQVVNEHNKISKRLLFISLLISTFIFVNSNAIVLVLFGERWGGVIPLIEIFSFMIPIQTVASTSGSFFQVMNKPKLLFISGCISAVVNVTAICIGIYLQSVEKIAIGLLFGFSINFIQIYFILFRYCFKKSSKFFLKELSAGLVSALGPIMLYIMINKIVLTDNSYGYVLDGLLNVLFAMLSLFFFYKPLTKKLIQYKNSKSKFGL